MCPMTKHTIHDGVIKAVHEYDKQSASETIDLFLVSS